MNILLDKLCNHCTRGNILDKFQKYLTAFSQTVMMTSSNGNIFRVTGPLCGDVTGEFSAQRPVTRSFDVLFHLHLNKRLRKQS